MEQNDVEANQDVNNSIGKQGWIPKEYLEKFSEYKYVSPLTTRFESVVLNKFWNILIEYVPKSIAPNTITVIGLLFTFVPLLLVLMEDATMTQQVATWKYFLFAF